MRNSLLSRVLLSRSFLSLGASHLDLRSCQVLSSVSQDSTSQLLSPT